MSGENCNTTLRSPSHRRPVRLIALITSGLLSLMAVGLAQPAQAVGTPGQGDTSFNSYFGYPLVSGGVNAVAIAGDGSYLLGGGLTGKLVKVNTDGTTTGSAATFNTNVGSALNGAVNAITVLSNGQIVVGGDFTGLLKMFNPDGTTTGLAAGFNSNVTGLLDFVYQGVIGLARLSDDTIVVGGDFTGKLKLVNSDGTTTGSAATFNGHVGTTLGTTLYDYVNKMVVTADGSIIAGGNFSGNLKKFNTDGTTDGSAGAFNTQVGSSVPGVVRAIVLDEANSAITISGEGSPYVRRLNLDGTRTGATTTSFNAAMTTRSWRSSAYSLLANSDGSVIIAGDGGDVQEFNLDGSLTGDAATFNTNSPSTGRVMSMVSVPGGGYLLGGGIYSGVGRLNTDGSTTGAAGTFNLNVNGLIGSEVDAAVSFQGGILLGGYFDGNFRMINEDGSYTGAAASFNTNVGGAVGGQVKAIKVLASGKVLVGGDFAGYLKMFNADGTSTGTAATFNTNVASALDGAVNAIAELDDGSVVVGGSFTNGLKMFNADGTSTVPAATFNSNVGSVLGGTVKAVVELEDGTVVVGGYFTGKLKAFNATGTTTGVAATFNMNVGSSIDNDVYTLGITSGGSLVVGGYFTGKLKMFNADGTTTGAPAVFNGNTSTIFSGSVYNLSVSSDDSIVAVGDFTDYVKRVNADGTVTGDSATFNTNVPNILDYEAYATVFTSDGGVVVGCGCSMPSGTATTRNLYKFYGGGFPVGGSDGGSGGSGSGSSGGSGSSSSGGSSSSSSSGSVSSVVVSAPAVLGPVLLGSASSLPSSGVAPGASVFLVNGSPQPVTVVPDSSARPTALLASGGGVALRLAGLDRLGGALGVSGKAALVLQPDNSLSVEGSGVAPNSDVPVYLFSTPRLLGTVHADATGSFKGLVPVPKDLELGQHTLQVNAIGSDGAVRSLSLGVVLQAPKATAQKVAKATVKFASGSAWLSAKAKATLSALAKKVGAKTSAGLVLGYVQPYGKGSTSPVMAMQRAKVIAKYLSAHGVKGRLATRGDGSVPSGASARKASVTLQYTP